MLEFTGERVIPELADPDLLNEHRARYRFAARFLNRFDGAAVLDAGCGAGYGSAELAGAASVTAMDIARDAVHYAREKFARPGIRFLQAACESLPFADHSFDLITAFEVIEHLERWPEMLASARRVLKPSGILLVSTPNKSYYAESRAEAGPNPFHVREFEYEEFRTALEEVFPHVHLWTQNHVGAVAFEPGTAVRKVFDSPDHTSPETAHFFLAACSMTPVGDLEAFAYMPSSGNVLRERERHIALLEGEVEQKTDWLLQMEHKHEELNRAHEAVLAELHHHNAWAEGLNEELRQFRLRVAEWTRDLEEQIATGRAEIARLNAENTGLRVDFEERTQWGESMAEALVRERAKSAGLEESVARLEATLAAVEQTRWVRLGRALHIDLGPENGS